MQRFCRLMGLSFLAVLCCVAFGCGDSAGSGNGSGGGDGDGGGGASEQEVNTCKQACQKQKFFDCYNAQEHAACFDKCEQASSSDIETFAGCVGTDTCDAECSLDVETGGSSGGDGSGGSGGGSDTSVSECVSSCEALAEDGCGRFGSVDCQKACEMADESERNALIYCEGARTNQCEFPEECQGLTEEGAARQQCKFACQTMGQQMCITSSDVTECQSRCDEISAEEAESFVSCVNSGICMDDTCYEQISEGGASADVTGCKSTCDTMSSEDCINSDQHNNCRSLCEEASKETIETFKACEDPTSFCDDDSCYQTFQSSVGG